MDRPRLNFATKYGQKYGTSSSRCFIRRVLDAIPGQRAFDQLHDGRGELMQIQLRTLTIEGDMYTNLKLIFPVRQMAKFPLRPQRVFGFCANSDLPLIMYA